MSFFPLIVGLFLFISIYVDDFKCKSMQVAIGYGISRRKIILAKLLESTALLLSMIAIIGVFIILTPIVIGLNINQLQMKSLIFTMFEEMLRVLGYVTISTIPMFFTQNAVNGIIFYVLFSSKTVYIILTMILGQDVIINIFGNLTKYLYTIQLYNIKEAIINNEKFGIALIFTIIIYIAIPTIISIIDIYI